MYILYRMQLLTFDNDADLITYCSRALKYVKGRESWSHFLLFFFASRFMRVYIVKIYASYLSLSRKLIKSN